MSPRGMGRVGYVDQTVVRSGSNEASHRFEHRIHVLKELIRDVRKAIRFADHNATGFDGFPPPAMWSLSTRNTSNTVFESRGPGLSSCSILPRKSSMPRQTVRETDSLVRN